MFSLSQHSWKSAGILSSRDKGFKNGNHDSQRTNNQHNNNEDTEEEPSKAEEELQAPMVRIGVLSRSSSTQVESVEMMPPSRIQSARVSDSSIETIRQSLREMEAQLVVAQNTVAAEQRAEYDLNENITRVNQESEVFAPPATKVATSTKEDHDDDKENHDCHTDDQDIKRVLDDLQWAEFVTFRNPKPTHTRSRSQTGKAAMCIKSMGRNCHPERQGKSWWRKHRITSENTSGQ